MFAGFWTEWFASPRPASSIVFLSIQYKPEAQHSASIGTSQADRVRRALPEIASERGLVVLPELVDIQVSDLGEWLNRAEVKEHLDKATAINTLAKWRGRSAFSM